MSPSFRSAGQHFDALRGAVRPAGLPLRVVEEDALPRTEHAQRPYGDAFPLGCSLLYEM